VTVQDARVTVSTQDRIEALYREQGGRLWRSVLAFTGDREVASDAVAEAFAQALGRGVAIRDPAKWVWKAAFRIAAGELKRRRTTTTEVESEYEPAESGELVTALQRLSPHQRAAVVLHHYGGYRASEVAAIIGSTTAAVKVHLSRGRKRLRDVLESDDA
jgi:RNA polymerase sigma-70 factor (ECF subfamily)